MIADGVHYRAGGDGVAWRWTGDEVVVLDLRNSVYYGLNGTGAASWRLLADGATRRDLAELLRRRGAAEEVAVRDTDAFLAHLRRYGLLSEEPPAS